MLAQTGQEEAAIKEMQKIARRAPGSADMRVALASLYWSKGEEAAAESEWEFACNKITGEWVGGWACLRVTFVRWYVS